MRRRLKQRLDTEVATLLLLLYDRLGKPVCEDQAVGRIAASV